MERIKESRREENQDAAAQHKLFSETFVSRCVCVCVHACLRLITLVEKSLQPAD